MATENVYRVNMDCPGCPFLDPEGPLSSMVPSSNIRAANFRSEQPTLEVKPVLMDESTATIQNIP